MVILKHQIGKISNISNEPAALVYGYASNPGYCPGYGDAAAAAAAFCCGKAWFRTN